MAEWRFGHGWSDAELRERLVWIEGLERNVPQGSDMDPSWRRQDLEEVVGWEEAGAPVVGGAFHRAKQVLLGYGFSDPRIVAGYFDAARSLKDRRMLLDLRVLGLHFLCPTALGEVLEEHNEERSVFGYRYDTLDGHLESGVEWFLVTKDHESGDVRFRIRSIWRPGQFPNWWSRTGFRWLGSRYQAAWQELAFLRMRELIASPDGCAPLATPGGEQAGIFHSSSFNSCLRDLYGTRARATVLAAGLGAVAGMRTLLPPALLSAQLGGDRGHAGGNAAGRLLASKSTRTVLAAAAVGEMGADKTSWIPPRTEPLALTGRVLSGALTGAVVASRRAGVDWAPVAAGALGALAGAHLSARFRRGATHGLGGSGSAAGLVEDVAGIVVGTLLARRV